LKLVYTYRSETTGRLRKHTTIELKQSKDGRYYITMKYNTYADNLFCQPLVSQNLVGEIIKFVKSLGKQLYERWLERPFRYGSPKVISTYKFNNLTIRIEEGYAHYKFRVYPNKRRKAIKDFMLRISKLTDKWR